MICGVMKIIEGLSNSGFAGMQRANRAAAGREREPVTSRAKDPGFAGIHHCVADGRPPGSHVTTMLWCTLRSDSGLSVRYVSMFALGSILKRDVGLILCGCNSSCLKRFKLDVGKYYAGIED
jgi:hypothetical protein